MILNVYLQLKRKVMSLSKKYVFIYLLLHTLFTSFVSIWYCTGDVYFGYELGDIPIILTIIIFSLLSLFLLISYKKLSLVIKYLFILTSIICDIFVTYLIINRYW